MNLWRRPKGIRLRTQNACGCPPTTQSCDVAQGLRKKSKWIWDVSTTVLWCVHNHVPKPLWVMTHKAFVWCGTRIVKKIKMMLWRVHYHIEIDLYVYMYINMYIFIEGISKFIEGSSKSFWISHNHWGSPNIIVDFSTIIEGNGVNHFGKKCSNLG